MRVPPPTVGKCERYLPQQKQVCHKSGRYIVYGSKVLCKDCYARFRVGRETLFDPGVKPSPARQWMDRMRLVADLPEG